MLSSKLLTNTTTITSYIVNQLTRNFSTTPLTLAPGNIRRRRNGTPSPKSWFRRNDTEFQWNLEKLEKPEFLSGGESPFPANSLFKPNTPLSYQTKDKIFEHYKSNPQKNTPRVLAERFNVSIRRVEAILKIRSMQEELVQDGFTVQSNYQDGMDKILGAKSFHNPEPLAIEIPKVKKPVFIALDEEVEFEREKAAEFLGKKPYIDLKERLGDKPFEYHGLKGDKPPKEAVAPKVIEHNPLTSNRRFTYTITDINPNLPFNKRNVTIRERDGTLREASNFERKLNLKRSWPNQKYYFKKESTL